MNAKKLKFEIICKELTPERKRLLAEREVLTFSKPLRAVMAAGGVWIFYYGTSFDVPVLVQGVAYVFAAIGLAAVVMAIFSQKLMEMSYFYKTNKKGCFPASVSIGEGGVFVKRREPKKKTGTPGVTSVNAERFFAFPEVGEIEDYGDYFKMNLSGGTPGVFLFKEDFGKGDPEAFKVFISSRHLRS